MKKHPEGLAISADAELAVCLTSTAFPLLSLAGPAAGRSPAPDIV